MFPSLHLHFERKRSSRICSVTGFDNPLFPSSTSVFVFILIQFFFQPRSLHPDHYKTVLPNLSYPLQIYWFWFFGPLQSVKLNFSSCFARILTFFAFDRFFISTLSLRTKIYPPLPFLL